MSRNSGRRQFTFTLYENNKKDTVVIKLLEKIPQSARGKVLRGIVLDAFIDELGMLKDNESSETDESSNTVKKYPSQKTNLHEMKESKKANNKSTENNKQSEGTDDINPFDDLDI